VPRPHTGPPPGDFIQRVRPLENVHSNMLRYYPAVAVLQNHCNMCKCRQQQSINHIVDTACGRTAIPLR